MGCDQNATRCNQRELGPENIDWGRILLWGFAVKFLLTFVVIGVVATLWWPWDNIGKDLLILSGLLALGGLAALFTAMKSAMDIVKFHPDRPARKRALLCIQRASRLEAVFHVLIGASIGGGAYWLANLC